MLKALLALRVNVESPEVRKVPFEVLGENGYD